MVSLPSLDQNGRILENDIISVHWMDEKPTSEALLVISCGCKTSYTTKRCSCVSQNLSCTDSCRCSELCQNQIANDSVEESDEDSDSNE